MRQFLLDTSALLALREDEPGAERVADLLKDSAVQCHACFMTRMEVLYRVWEDEGELAGKLALQQCLALPLDWVEASDALLLQAAELKAGFSISVVDAWIAAAAMRQGATLLHKDPEFEALAIEQEWLPLKSRQ
ncbi:MAG: PIN domain-containing protein [Wenzhouxiangella sp.]|nr:PIN domain-containing protein [Wenzhouxiangella sp.]